MKNKMDWMPPVRHKRSQNAGVLYTLDEGMALVDVLMRSSSEQVNSEARSLVLNYAEWAIVGPIWVEILGPESWQVNERGRRWRSADWSRSWPS